jgi:hypothetical protein
MRALAAAVCAALFLGVAYTSRMFHAAAPCSPVILRPDVAKSPKVEQLYPRDAAAVLPKLPQQPGGDGGGSAATDRSSRRRKSSSKSSSNSRRKSSSKSMHQPPQQLQPQPTQEQEQQPQQPHAQEPQQEEQPRGADYYERERQRLGLLAPTLPDAQCVPPQPRERPAADQYFAVCTVVKDQNTDILEWALYHHMIGASKIYVFDNNSTMPMIRELHPLVEAGVVEYVYFRRDPALRPSPIACPRRGAPLHLPLAHETTTTSSGCPDQWEAGRVAACASCL